MNLVRAYKISKLTNKPLSDEEKEIIDFIQWKISNLNEYVITTPYVFSTCYMDNNGKFIFQIQKKDNVNKLNISGYGFLDYLKIVHSINYKDSQSIIQYFIEQKYNLKINETDFLNDVWRIEIEKDYKKIRNEI